MKNAVHLAAGGRGLMKWMYVWYDCILEVYLHFAYAGTMSINSSLNFLVECNCSLVQLVYQCVTIVWTVRHSFTDRTPAREIVILRTFEFRQHCICCLCTCSSLVYTKRAAAKSSLLNSPHWFFIRCSYSSCPRSSAMDEMLHFSPYCLPLK